MILWGTGLGPVNSDESVGPLPNQPTDIRANVWVGEKQAKVLYQGRSGCCAGIDQIVFEIPTGAEGCYVPVAVEAGGVFSNSATLSIAAPGSTSCSTPALPVPSIRPNLSVGVIGAYDLDFALPGASGKIQDLSATFERVTADSLDTNLAKVLADGISSQPAIPPGTCILNPPAPPLDLTKYETEGVSIGLDAGSQIRVTGPARSVLLQQGLKGIYSSDTTPTDFLTSGRYRIDNGNGGLNVGPFAFDMDFYSVKFIGQPSVVSRSQDLTLRWTVPPNAQGLVEISGSSLGACGTKEVSFSCLANVNAGQITVPSRILSQLPVSEAGSPFIPGGTLYIGPWLGNTIKTFTAPGLDVGMSFIFSAQIRTANFR